MVYGLLLIISGLLIAGNQAYVQPGTCQTLQAASGAVVCSRTVTYSFFLPNGMTTARLNGLAISKLNSTQFTILPPTCQAAFMNYVCSQIYLKCSPGVNLTVPGASYSTWNKQIYASVAKVFPVPFQRPCASVCSTISTACLGLTNLFGQTPSCTARFDYSYGLIPLPLTQQPFQFDPITTNSPAICNPMSSPASISVAGTIESYAAGASGACAGITSSLYVPSAYVISGGQLAPMQAPGVVQSLIESKLQTAFSVLPVWLSEDCHFALKKYVCSSSFLLPQQQILGNVLVANGIPLTALQPIPGSNASKTFNYAGFAALMAYSFYLPSFPAQQICTDYASKCSAFISLAGNPTLVPNCAATSTSATGLVTEQYPTVDQTVVQSVVSSHPVNFVTSPNTMVGVVDTSGYATSCPEGFVIPDDPSDPDTQWVPGTGCAAACWAPEFTPSEWSNISLASKVLSAMGFTFIIILLAMVAASPKWRQEVAVVSFISSSAVITLWVLIGSGGSAYKHQCRNNANGYNYRDGVTTCTVQAGFILYFSLTCVLSWFCVILEQFFVSALQWDPTASESKKLYSACIFTFIYVLPLTIFFSAPWFGYSQEFPFCSYASTAPKDADMFVFGVPVAVITLAGSVLLLGLIKSLIFGAKSAEGYSTAASIEDGAATADSTKTTPPPMADPTKRSTVIQLTIFAVLFLVVWVTVFGNRFRQYRVQDQTTQSLHAWVQCVFKNYNGLSQDSWISACGPVYHNRFDFNTYAWVIFSTAGQSILVACIFVPIVAPALVPPAVSTSSPSPPVSAAVVKEVELSVVPPAVPPIVPPAVPSAPELEVIEGVQISVVPPAESSP